MSGPPDPITVIDEFLEEFARLGWEITSLTDDDKAELHYGNLFAFLTPKDRSRFEDKQMQQPISTRP